MPKFISTTSHTIQVPMSATKAADTLHAIAVRNDTHPIIGERSFGKAFASGYHVPIDYDAMGFIIGRELAENFIVSMAKPAYAEYFNKVNARMKTSGVVLGWTSEYWYIQGLPRFEPNRESEYVYTYQSLVDQAPNGFSA